jgi:hypothetical protein
MPQWMQARAGSVSKEMGAVLTPPRYCGVSEATRRQNAAA